MPFVSYVSFLVNAVTSGQTTGITVEAPPGPAWLASPPVGPYSMSVEGETISFTSFSATAQGETVLAGVTRGATVSHPVQAVCLMSVGHFNPPPVTAVPTLQQVTDAGNTTTDVINANGGIDVAGVQSIDVGGDFYYAGGLVQLATETNLFYPQANPLADIGGNLYYSDGEVLSTSTGNLNYGNGSILADATGTLFYGTGNAIADAPGNFYVPSGIRLADSLGQLYYVNGQIFVDNFGTVFYSNNTPLADNVGNVYGNGSNLISLNASSLSTGTVATACLGSGSASSTTFLRGDQTWATINQAFAITSANLTGQTAGVASVATVTPGTLGTYRVGAYINVTARTVDVVQVQCTYKDETGTTQTITLSGLIASTGVTNINPVDIRAASSQAIIIKTVLTTGGGSIAYDIGATIQQLN